MLSDHQSPKCKHAPYVNNFDFDLTCDVIGDLEVNEIRFHSTVLTGLSNAVGILKKGPVVSEIGGGSPNSPPISRVTGYTPVRRALTFISAYRLAFGRHLWALPFTNKS